MVLRSSATSERRSRAESNAEQYRRREPSRRAEQNRAKSRAEDETSRAETRCCVVEAATIRSRSRAEAEAEADAEAEQSKADRVPSDDHEMKREPQLWKSALLYRSA